jgi:hypothetical protein
MAVMRCGASFGLPDGTFSPAFPWAKAHGSTLKRVPKKALARVIGRRKRLPHHRSSTDYKPWWDRHSARQPFLQHLLKRAPRAGAAG